jgi:hypothetical protein
VDLSGYVENRRDFAVPDCKCRFHLLTDVMQSLCRDGPGTMFWA